MKAALFAIFPWLLAIGCSPGFAADLPFESGSESTDQCLFVESGFGPPGDVDIEVETVVSGLNTPWSLVFLPDGDMLVTERPGRVRLVDDGELVDEPIALLETAGGDEGGLLGAALHPGFEENRLFYLYVTREGSAGGENRVELWRLDEGGRAASLERVLLDGIPAARFHDGGRLRTGPDGMLYVGTGDARTPELARDPDSLAGKILRLTPDGGVPDDNPIDGSPVFVLGVRNVQAFDFFSDGRLVIADHGPSGELFRTGGDEVSFASGGDDLGWPTIWQCEAQEGLISPVLAYDEALPPGGAAFYTGDDITAWRGALLIGALRARQLQLVRFDEAGTAVVENEVYLDEELGRLRDVVMGPDGALYLTTSNCDGRGECPPGGDRVARVFSAR